MPTIKTTRNKKKDLEQRIKGLIQTFCAEHEVSVTGMGIDLEPDRFGNKVVTEVSLKVEVM